VYYIRKSTSDEAADRQASEGGPYEGEITHREAMETG
jgi:hypothetical protein